MVEKFEEIFEAVMVEKGIEAWYELYDSEDFDDVEALIAETYGADVLESKEYVDWVTELYWDL